LVQQVNSNELLFSKIIPEHNDTFIPILHKFQKSIIKYVGLVLLQPLTKSRSPLLIVKLATCKGPNKSFPPLLLPLNLSRYAGPTGVLITGASPFSYSTPFLFQI